MPVDGMMVAQHILDREGSIMAYRWPEETVFTRLALTVEEPWCRTCGGALTICDHRHHRVFTLNGPVHLVCKLAHCPARACPAHTQTLRTELADTYHIPLSDDAIERYIHRYQQMLAARHRDPQQLVAAYAQVDAIILAIDGLQPEKGHETLSVAA